MEGVISFAELVVAESVIVIIILNGGAHIIRKTAKDCQLFGFFISHLVFDALFVDVVYGNSEETEKICI